tara:strand:- start:1727 stop:2269 length:543 start_codon:yes stop_codon:yes gene_type:complete
VSYFKEFLKDKNVGAISSSSKAMGNKMYGSLNLKDSKAVVEFGAGDGVFTTEIIRLIGNETKFFVFETNESLFNVLKEKINDERVILINDSAEKIGEYLLNYKISQVDYIISALPLSLIPADIKNSIIKNALNSLKNDGQYVQFQYTPYDYLRLRRYFKKVKLSFTLTNFPPAFLYRCFP